MAWAGSQKPTHPFTEQPEDKEDKGSRASKEDNRERSQIVNNELGEINIGDMKEFPP